MKYIKIVGSMNSVVSRNASSDDYCTYKEVVIIDNEGDEVHFYGITMSLQLEKQITKGRRSTFYILASRRGGRLVGVLYAMKVGDRSYYYQDLAIRQLKGLALQTHKRYFFISNWALGTPLLALFGMVLNIVIGINFNFDKQLLLPFCFIIPAFYVYLPFFTQGRRAGISKMKSIVKAEGLINESKAVNKYA